MPVSYACLEGIALAYKLVYTKPRVSTQPWQKTWLGTHPVKKSWNNFL